MHDDTWGGRWHDWCAYTFFWATGAVTFGAVFSVTGWTFDLIVVTFIVLPLSAVLWTVLATILFLPFAPLTSARWACVSTLLSGRWGGSPARAGRSGVPPSVWMVCAWQRAPRAIDEFWRVRVLFRTDPSDTAAGVVPTAGGVCRCGCSRRHRRPRPGVAPLRARAPGRRFARGRRLARPAAVAVEDRGLGPAACSRGVGLFRDPPAPAGGVPVEELADARALERVGRLCRVRSGSCRRARPTHR